MPSYLEYLQTKPNHNGIDCALGTVLRREGREKHDEILETIFLTDELGNLYPVSHLIDLWEEYGWGEFFFRRHRTGRCRSCLNRPTQSG